MNHCLAVLRGAATDPDAGRRVALACSALYSEAGCREGFARAWSDVTSAADRVAVFTDACRDAYCPGLAEPRPQLCAGVVGSLGDRAMQWQEFSRRILVRDLGPARAAAIEDAMRELASRRLPLTAPRPEARRSPGPPR
ncbi:MAG: hypothetical protein NVSMB47_20590 [Polyangiales bacterium]